MGFPTGTFRSPHAGRLVVTLTGVFEASSYVEGGFPSSGVVNLAIRGFAGPSGAPDYTAPIDRYVNIAEIELDYPGNVDWPVGVEHVAHTFSGPSYSAYRKIRLSCTLIKR